MKRLIRTYEFLADVFYQKQLIYKKGDKVTDPLIIISSPGHPYPFTTVDREVYTIQTDKTIPLNRLGVIIVHPNEIKVVDEIINQTVEITYKVECATCGGIRDHKRSEGKTVLCTECGSIMLTTS